MKRYESVVKGFPLRSKTFRSPGGGNAITFSPAGEHKVTQVPAGLFLVLEDLGLIVDNKVSPDPMYRVVALWDGKIATFNFTVGFMLELENVDGTYVLFEKPDEASFVRKDAPNE